MLRTLPGSARRRLPWRMRHPARWVASLALLGAIVAIALIARRRQSAPRHRRRRRTSSRTRACEPVPLGQTAAHDYNPFGTGPENRDQIGNVVDGDPNTTWSTEQYYDGTLKKAGGVGARACTSTPRPACSRKAIEIQTPTPGFAAQIYVADHIDLSLPYGNSTPLTARGWQGPVGASADVRSGERIPLALGGQPLSLLPGLADHAAAATWSPRRSPS